MADRLSTLDVITAQANRERDAQARHFESLDGKAGIIMGFSGVVVALGAGRSAFGIAAHLAAALAALLSLWAFTPRKLPLTRVDELAELYSTADAAFVKVHLLAATVTIVGEASPLVTMKARKVALAMRVLAASVVLTTVAILFAR